MAAITERSIALAILNNLALIFISYRCNEFDKLLVRGIFDAFTSYTLGKESLPVEVFLDVKRLKSGRKYDNDFFLALLKSDVVVLWYHMQACHLVRLVVKLIIS